jgi:uncharacterized protein HemX
MFGGGGVSEEQRRMISDLLSSHLLIFIAGLGLGLGVGLVFWRRRSHQYENFRHQIESTQEKKMVRYQAAVQRIKEREAKIGELRKEIYHKDQIIRDLNQQLKGHPQGARASNKSWTTLVY